MRACVLTQISEEPAPASSASLLATPMHDGQSSKLESQDTQTELSSHKLVVMAYQSHRAVVA